MSTTTTDTKPATPAAKRASRARTKSADTKAKVDAMNDRSRELTRAQLIEKARRVGILKPAGMSKPDLEKAIAAAEAKATKGIVDAVVESAKSGPNAQATKAVASKATGAGKAIAKAVAAAPSPSAPSRPAAQLRRTTRGPRGVEARKVAAKLGKRGPGKKITDDDLVKYCVKVAKAHPETTASDELEQAYWVEKLAVNRDRFYRAWAEAMKAKAA